MLIVDAHGTQLFMLDTFQFMSYPASTAVCPLWLICKQGIDGNDKIKTPILGQDASLVSTEQDYCLDLNHSEVESSGYYIYY